MSYEYLMQVIKGGTGSGNFAHGGRPGKVGGSVSKSTVGSYRIPGTNYDVTIIKGGGDITGIINNAKKSKINTMPAIYNVDTGNWHIANADTHSIFHGAFNKQAREGRSGEDETFTVRALLDVSTKRLTLYDFSSDKYLEQIAGSNSSYQRIVRANINDTLNNVERHIPVANGRELSYRFVDPGSLF